MPGCRCPAGVALSVDAVEAVVRADPEIGPALHRVCADGGPRAVRSSAVREDSAGASFAGAYCTVLGVCDPDAVVAAVRRVHASARRPRCSRLPGAARAPTVRGWAVVIQELVPADVAGVLFTRNPVTGAAERVIEASWGLGESVVAGLVIPDRYRLDARGPGAGTDDRRQGRRVADDMGGRSGRSAESAVDASDVHAPCLDDVQLAALHRLAEACDTVFGSRDHDIEFAFHAGAVFLLQRRPITGG